MEDKVKKVYRLPPCPSYDVEGTESWLADMEEEGLSLEKDGIFMGFAAFIKGTPRKARYRLEAARKSTSMWSENDGEPEDEAVELSSKYGWEYIAKRGGFYIYRSVDESDRELNTDPDVQAMALKTVVKRQHSALFLTIFWALIYPLIGIRGSILTVTVEMGDFFVLLSMVLLLWLVIDPIVRLVYLGKLRKRLIEGTKMHQDERWRRKAAAYHVKNGIKTVLIALWLVLVIGKWSDETQDKGKIPLEDFDGSVPFATMADFCDGEYRLDDFGVGNTVETASSVLVPEAVSWSEHATVRSESGEVISGGLYVDYYRTVGSRAAKQIERELWWQEKWEKSVEKLEAPNIQADSVSAYCIVGMPTVIMRVGDTVIKVMFYQTGSSSIAIDEWAEIVLESIK